MLEAIIVGQKQKRNNSAKIACKILEIFNNISLNANKYSSKGFRKSGYLAYPHPTLTCWCHTWMAPYVWLKYVDFWKVEMELIWTENESIMCRIITYSTENNYNLFYAPNGEIFNIRNFIEKILHSYHHASFIVIFKTILDKEKQCVVIWVKNRFMVCFPG